MFDKSTYSKNTLDIFEVISSYFVDIYYNHLYLEAKKEKINNNVSCITEGYKHALNAFLQSLDNEKFYKKYLVDLHNYFTETGLIQTAPFSSCMEIISNEFIPNDFLKTLTITQKMKFLRVVLTQANKKLIEIIVKEYFCSIIDDHQNEENVRILQDRFIELLIVEREFIYQRFVSSQTKTNVKTPQVNNSMIQKMVQEIKILHKEKYDLKKKNLELKKIIITRDRDRKKYVENIKLLENTINELRSELKEPKPINSYNTEYSSIVNNINENVVEDEDEENDSHKDSDADADTNEDVNEEYKNKESNILFDNWSNY